MSKGRYERVWVIHMSRLRHEAELWDRVNAGAVAIGWKQIDLTKLPTREAIELELRNLPEPRTDQAIAIYVTQLHRFACEMNVGDLVVLPVAGSQAVKIGEVTSDSVRRDENFDEELVHIRKVKWLKDVTRQQYSQEARYALGAYSSISLGSPTVLAETIALLEGRTPVAPTPGDELEETAGVSLEQLIEERRDEFISAIIDNNLGHKYTQIVAALLRAMGYVTDIAPPGPDGKRDIMAYRDELKVEDPVIRVEVKSSHSAIGVDEIRALRGALQRGQKGLFIARSGYTQEARREVRNHAELTLLDGEDVVRLLLKYYENLDTETKQLIPLKRVWVPVEGATHGPSSSSTT